MSTVDSTYKAQCEVMDLPILYIVTNDSVMPTYTVVYAPEGCSGRGITDNEKVPAHMWIVRQGDTIYDSGAYVKDTAGITIKVRGNTTASDRSDKKPYKLKLQKKTDLLFRGNDALYADKDWVLLRNEIYETMVGNMTNQLLGMEWTPAQTPVFVFLNDNFRGVYLLTENIKRNTRCRVNVAKTGFLIEYDAYWWNEDYYIASPRFGQKINYTLTYPESDDILPWQVDYLTNHIATVEDYLVTRQNLDSVIDVHSYARWLWVHDILGNRDAHGSNIYLTKYDTTLVSKQKMICAWDFSGCFTPNISWSLIHNDAWFSQFFSQPQHQFIQEYIRIYDSQVQNSFDTLVQQINTLQQSASTMVLDNALALDEQRWKKDNISGLSLQEIADYLSNRKSTVANLMTSLKEAYGYPTTALSEVTYTYPEEQVYTILGNPASKTSRGVILIIRTNDGLVKKVMY